MSRVRPESGFGSEESDDLLNAGARGVGFVFEFDLAGLDLGEIKNIVDQKQQRVAAVANEGDVCALLGVEFGVAENLGEADDATDWITDFVADDGEEFALGAVGGFGGIFGPQKDHLGHLSRGDVVADGLVFDHAMVLVVNFADDPLQPRRAAGTLDFLFVGLGGRIVFPRQTPAGGVSAEGLTEELGAFALEKAAVGTVDENQGEIGTVAANQIELILDNSAVAGFDALERPGHAFDLAGEADDFIVANIFGGCRFDALSTVVNFTLGGLCLITESPNPLENGDVPQVTAQHQQDATNDGQ